MVKKEVDTTYSATFFTENGIKTKASLGYRNGILIKSTYGSMDMRQVNGKIKNDAMTMMLEQKELIESVRLWFEEIKANYPQETAPEPAPLEG